MGKVTFADAIWLALTGDLPDAALSRLVNAMLVSSVDHGATPPSTLAARTVASTGAPLNAAVAAGVLAISRQHGGAIEECMHTLMEAVSLAKSGGASYGAAAAQVLAEYKGKGRRVSGFGHRIHTDDPRTKRLFGLAEAAERSGDHVKMAKAFEDTLRSQGKLLPINVDGAIAAVLCDLGIDPKLANGFFIMARVPGLVAHVAEEQTRERPVRTIHPTDHGYDGPEPRGLPGKER
jgi:citrate synthase